MTQKKLFRFSVKEEQEPGAFVGQLTNLDKHGTYCFTSSCGWSSLFDLNKQTGIISTAASIDRESLPSGSMIQLTLTGTDSHGSNILEVIDVEIEDINDNSPTFAASECTLVVSENLGPQVFDLLSWSDSDAGENGKLKKAQILEISDQSWPFIPEIKTSGNFQQVVLKITQSLDREDVDRYEFIVQIEDNGFPTQTGNLTVIIDVQDVNDNTPVFKKNNYRFEISENVPVPHVIHQFVATDSDFEDNGEVEYSLSHDYTKAYFEIDESNGQLSLIATIDYESRIGNKGFSLIVYAQDKGISPRRASTSVEIVVLDVNDNSPAITFLSPFMTTTDTVEILENIDVDTYTATIIISDEDSGVNGECDVVIDSGGFGNFKLKETSKSKLLLTADHIDREARSVYKVIIKATDRGKPSLEATKTLTVNILDENDNSPQFTKELYTARVSESVQTDSLILSVKAIDEDFGENGSVSYRIETQSVGDFFKISSSGNIFNSKELDAESNKFHILNVSASDGGNPALKSFTVVNVTVMDVNDNSPVFERSLYTCNVPESSLIGSVVCSVTAYDLDSGHNGEITYSTDQTNGFQINHSTGDITLSVALDYETAKIHKLTIRASDNGNPVKHTTCEVVINVEDLNDETPWFDPVSYSATIPEGVVFSSILQVYAYDDDEGDNVQLSLTSGDFSKFSISPSGIISNTEKFQYSGSSSTFNFKVAARDNANNEASPLASVSINVVQKSPDLPIFTEGVLKTSVLENSPVGHTVTTITATTDSSCSISYNLEPDSTYFSVESDTGLLKIRKQINYELIKRFRLPVTASCNSLKGHAIVEVDVIDVNDNAPVCENMGTIFVEEDSAVGTPVYDCVCSDADSGVNAELSFSIKSNSPLFSISNKGELSVASLLDRETLATVLLSIEVCDKGKTASLCSEYDVTVEITDVNDNHPEFLDPLTFNVKEDVKINHAIGKLRATDKDEGKNQELVFTVINSVPQINVFSSGEIVVDQILDYETFDRLFLNVRVSDQGVPSLSAEAIVKIIIQDANDNAPQFDKEEYEFSVQEHQPVPFILGSVSATDVDTLDNGRVVYSLLDGLNAFEINSTTGELTLTADVDFESSLTPYTLSVVASDNGTPLQKSQVSVSINVLDINDNKPTFAQDLYSVLIAENVPINSKIFDVSASDRDGPLNNQIIYSFEEEQDNFRIDSSNGSVFTKKLLDFEEIQSFSIWVKAEDNGSPQLSSRAQLVINLSDVNDNAPQFETDTLEIGVVESTSPGTVIQRIEASDMDSENNGRLTYSFTSESDPGIFSLESTSGDLRLLQKLKFSGKIYELEVQATDHGPVQLSSSQNLRITVIDVNDNAPVFDDGIVSVNVVENSPKGTPAFRVSATDQDSGPAGIVNYNISSSFFTIERMSGKVSVTKEIDRERNDTLLVTVCATDQASPVSEQLSACKDITVNVLDVNDNTPEFADQEPDIYVHENTVVSKTISTIRAYDLDYKANGSVTFSIVGKDAAQLVSIDANSGEVALVKKLDFEESDFAGSFTVKIRDQGDPYLENTKQFFLYVIDDNDNPPVFLNPVSQRSVYLPSSVTAQSIIYMAMATDADSGMNSKILYLLPNTFDDKFSINEVTGDITINSKVDQSFERTLLNVKATDTGDPALSEVMVVNVEFKDKNTKPICPSKAYTSVPENAMSYKTIFEIECYDLDWGARGSLRYSILNGNIGDVFSVSADGKVSLTQNRLDYEKLRMYSLLIHVEDLGEPSLKEIFILDVTVTNINDEAPIFTAGEIVMYVSEGESIGSLLKTVVATDADGDSITYSSSILTVECEGYFNLNPQTGQLTLAKEIDAALMDFTTLCEISIGASDELFTTETLVSILIEDIDNNVPVFYSSPSFNVNTASTSIVGAVGASDADSGDTDLIYMISGSKRSTGFAIDPNSGIISCPDSSCPAGDVQIKTSGRNMSSSTTISISWDSSPVLQVFSQSEYSFSVKESAAVDFIIGRIGVQNEPDDITIEGGNYGLSFKIQNKNLLVNKKLDFEVWPSFNLTLCGVLNSVSTFSSIFITVEDVNDNIPTFRPSTLIREIKSNLRIGAEVYQAEGFDADSGLSGELLYYLGDSVFNDYFNIETQTGLITVNRELHDAPLNMDIQVKAKDQGSPALTSNTLNLILNIVHQPVAPEFAEPSFSFKAYADASAYSILGTIDVVNNDHDDYTFVFEKESQYFTIYSASGYIVQKASITNNQLTEVQESVKVVSRSDPSVFGIVTANINIIQSICTPNPCKNGAKCIDSVDNYECECVAGTAGKNCECVDDECSNGGVCVYNSTMTEVQCLCEDGHYRENCNKSDSILLIAGIAGGGFVFLLIIIFVAVYCFIKRKRGKDKKAANIDFDNAVNGARLGSNKRMKGQLHLQDNICMNPINISNLDVDSKISYPEYSYTNHDYDLDSPLAVNSPSSQIPSHSFQYAASDSGHSSQCTEAVIFRKLKQVDEPNVVESQRRDKDSGLAGSLNTLCHFDMDYNNENYLQDWGPKVQNLVHVLDLEDVELDEDTPVKEEFV